MPKKKKTGNSGHSLSSLARSVSLLSSEVKMNSQELREMRGEMRTGFDQVYRHIDGFIKLHETLDIERRRELRDWKRADS